MTVIATISIPSEAFELGEILALDDGVKIELTQFVPVANQLVPYFWASDGDPRKFESEVCEDPRVKSLTALDSAADRTLYQIEWEDGVDGFLSALSAHEVIVEGATATSEKWTFRLRAHDGDALSRFHNACRDEDIPLTVQQVQHDPASPDANPYELTAKQRETILLAFEAGYFEVPHGVSLTELGDQLDISRQAVSRRLSRGLHTLVTHTIAESKPTSTTGPDDESIYHD